MKVLATTGNEDIANVYILDLGNNRLVECVESLQPPVPREKKWVLIISTMLGCPVGCNICDAGSFYHGKLSKEEIFCQIDFLVRKRYENNIIPAEKFKIQFARMGEPSLNVHVLDVLEELPFRYDAAGLIPSISTIAPVGKEEFFERLINIKNEFYSKGKFQMQFSIHTTDEKKRDQMIPVKKWPFEKISEYGERFFRIGDRKVTLNFALSDSVEIDSKLLRYIFNPEKFIIKITPVNPTYRSSHNNIKSFINPYDIKSNYEIINNLRSAGFDALLSVGEVEENLIGSNCGQFLLRHLNANELKLNDSYTYKTTEMI